MSIWDWASFAFSMVVGILCLLVILGFVLGGLAQAWDFFRNSTLDESIRGVGTWVAAAVFMVGLVVVFGWVASQVHEPRGILGHLVQWIVLFPIALFMLFILLMIVWGMVCMVVLLPMEWFCRFWRYVAENDYIEGDWRMRFSEWLRAKHDRIAIAVGWQKMKEPGTAGIRKSRGQTKEVPSGSK